MAKSKKMTLPQFRKQAKELTKDEMLQMLCTVYKQSVEAADILNIELGNDDYEKELLNKAKENVEKGFFTRGGRVRLSLPAARSAVSSFKKICRNKSNLIDLELCYAEYGAELSGNYYDLPDSLYQSTENMYESVIEAINEEGEEEGRSLFKQYEKRLQKVIDKSFGDESGLHEFLKECFSKIRWLPENDVNKMTDHVSEEPLEAGSYKLPNLSVTTTLPEDKGKLFYQLWFGLLNFVNKKEKAIDEGKADFSGGMDSESASTLSQLLWKDGQTNKYIDAYLASDGADLPEEHKALLDGWKRHVTGRFILERHLKKGSIFISVDDNKVYQSVGIMSSWDEMIPKYELPVILETTLIPFYNVIIPDSLIYPFNVVLGGGIKEQLKETYMTAKRRGQIISSL